MEALASVVRQLAIRRHESDCRFPADQGRVMVVLGETEATWSCSCSCGAIVQVPKKLIDDVLAAAGAVT